MGRWRGLCWSWGGFGRELKGTASAEAVPLRVCRLWLVVMWLGYGGGVCAGVGESLGVIYSLDGIKSLCSGV